MKLARLFIVALFLGALLFLGCDSGTTTKPAPTAAPVKKDPTLYTGKTCLQNMADVAQRWQVDAVPFQMESEPNSEANGQDGRSTIWHATFASPSSRNLKEFTCSGSRLKDSPAVGVTSTAEAPYPPSIVSAMFQIYALASDSDVAAKVAKEHGGDELVKKNPNQPIAYSLQWDGKQRRLKWFVVYGNSRKDSKGVGVVDAGNGSWVGVLK